MFGRVLKQARERKYRSAQQFAEKLGIEPHTYRTYERGQAEPNFETLIRICDDLGITTSDLLPTVSERDKGSESPSTSSAA